MVLPASWREPRVLRRMVDGEWEDLELVNGEKIGTTVVSHSCQTGVAAYDVACVHLPPRWQRFWEHPRESK